MTTFVRWVASDEFRPAPVFGPDQFATWRLVRLRIFEALSVGVLLAHLWFCVLVPLKQERDQLSLDGRHVIGGLLAVFADGFQYIFMWNAHARIICRDDSTTICVDEEICSGVRWGRKNEY
ncbi:hypothetical protein VTN77DRAFT_345 [Rasamsonia byssochlamydoides]|uniref:uncharacterized protein n=1 Tax=Rasamsonia byssochlamydoides TaxID=89139 RepID=UPI0037421D04